MNSIKLITKEELRKKIDRKEDLQVVNVLAPEYYHRVSISGSRMIPRSDLYGRIDGLDKSLEIVVCCAGYGYSASQRDAEKLAAKGFDVKVYEGGASRRRYPGNNRRFVRSAQSTKKGEI